MEIEIIKFTQQESGTKKGFLDFKVTYSATEWKAFKNVAYFEKGERRWLSSACTKRGETWEPYYDESGIKEIFEAVLKKFKNAVDTKEIKTDTYASALDMEW